MNECHHENFVFNGSVLPSSQFNYNWLVSGVSIYEVVRLIDGVPLYVEKHFERLQSSANKINLIFSWNLPRFKEAIEQVRQNNSVSNGNIKFVNTTNDYLVYFNQAVYPSQQQYKRGVPVGLMPAERNNPTVKFINKVLRNSAAEIIERKKLNEVILIDNENYITEGSRSNIFLLKDNEVFTPPENDVLPGITRLQVIEICIANNIKLTERKIRESELSSFDAVFLTSTSRSVLPVRTIKKLQFQTDNKLLHRIIQLFNKNTENYIRNYTHQ